MKLHTQAIAVALSLAAIAFVAPVAVADEHAGHGAMSDKAPGAMHDAMHGATPVAAPMADGKITKVDKPGGKLTIDHGPLPNGMPAMKMAFRVKDAAWLNQLKEGERIRFAVDTIKGELTVVGFERVK